MLGQRRAWDQIGMDAPMAPMDVPQISLPQAAPQAPRAKVNWAGILADALSGAMGRPGQYAAMNNQQRAEQTDFERGEQRYQRQRADGIEDWRMKQDYERANPGPPSGFAGELVQAGFQPGTPEYVEKLQQRITNQLDPFVTAPLPSGVYSGPRSGLASLGSGPAVTPKVPPPQVAIDELRRDPSAAREFDEMFGEGASAQALGGAGSQAPRGFR